jgi:AcrR family transcriptional regulator
MFYQKRREYIQKSILDTSIQLFRKNGYETTTVEEISKTVGVAKGTIYNFYNSKRDILMCWAYQVFQGMDFQQAFSPDRTVQQNMNTMIDLLEGYMASEEKLFIQFLHEFMSTYEASIADNQFEFKKIMTRVIESSKDYETFNRSNKNLKIDILNDALFMGVIHWFDQGKTVEGLNQYLKNILKICLFGMLNKGRLKNEDSRRSR